MVLFLTCNKDNQTVTITTPDDYTNLRTVFGITGYSNIVTFSDRITEFTILAEPTEINDRNMNLNHSKVIVERIGNKVDIYLIQTNDNSFKIIMDTKTNKIDFYTKSKFGSSSGKDTTTTTYELGGYDCIPFDTCNNTNPALAAMLFTGFDPVIASSKSLNVLFNLPAPTSKRDCQHPYIGYTLGVGFTSIEAQWHDSNVRNSASAKADIKKYQCNYLGTNTSCLLGENVCLATSTFECCND